MKANLPWIDAVGGKVAEGLAKRYARPMIYRQSGPYGKGMAAYGNIYFNDPILHYVGSSSLTHKTDFRFGFCVDWMIRNYINVGFNTLSPTLAHRFLMPNIRSNCPELASKVLSWLRRRRHLGGRIRFSLGAEQQFIGDGRLSQSQLAEALAAYANLGRKGNHSWKRYQFAVSCSMTKYTQWSETELIEQSDDLASSTLGAFAKLDFLYSLLFPRDLGAARLSGGQNRNLKVVQPDRRCSWESAEHCRGAVEAAHIKPDRMGGHAVASNLIWLCGFHHKLLDTYLSASLAIDRKSRRVVGSVRATPPPSSRADGIPRLIWEAIDDRRAWPLPLRAESIAHLFGPASVDEGI